LFTTFDTISAQAAQSAIFALTDLRTNGSDQIVFKANVRAGGVVEFLERAGRQPVPWVLHSHAGSGIVFGHAAAGSSLETLQSVLGELRAMAVQLQGNLVLMRCPTAWKIPLKVWGEPRGDAWLMAAIKSKLDPEHLMNPGRFLVA
jgi:glycolate oxidase FAD binding subunit